jgi:molybdate transport system permease protein
MSASSSSDRLFGAALWLLGGSYLAIILGMVAADVYYLAGARDLGNAGIFSSYVGQSVVLSLVSCTIAAVFSVLVGVPLGYLLARRRFWGKGVVEAIVDIPVVLPPLVVGLSLLILFNHVTVQGKSLEQWLNLCGFRVTYAVPAVILAQFAVAAAFAVRTMRVTFGQISPRTEDVALTLGCSRRQAFFRVALPQARRGVLAAFTLAWARSLGEFGPILIFAGATRGRTEVLSSTVFLELNVGHLEAAVAVSLLMILVAVAVLLILRHLSADEPLPP